MTHSSKPIVRRLTFLVIIMAALSLTMFSCTTYCAQNQQTYINMDDVTLRQLEDPEEDAPVAVIHTTLGDITAVLYPEEAPNYVAQFTRLAEEGYYDNTYIFEVEPDVYFSAGTASADGTLTDEEAALPQENVPLETSGDLWPFRGALCAPSTGHDSSIWKNLFGGALDYCGTRFLVCNSIEFDEETQEELESVDEAAQDLSDAFLERGGIPNYSQQMTVFGQAYGDESFATIDAITSVAVTQDADDDTAYTTPKESICITSITITTWAQVKDTL
jgi:peptidyl-prolyl cis-trans isomerase B (cyclophilin B)